MKNQPSYDALLIVASNLTLAEVNATDKATSDMKTRYIQQKTDDLIWKTFNSYLSRLEQLEIKEAD